MLEKLTSQENQELGFTFESERLSFEPVWNVDSEALAKAANVEQTAVMVGDAFPYPYRVKDADDFKNYSRLAWAKGKEYSFAISSKSGVFVGVIGFKISGPEEIVDNLGYWFDVAAHGQGYATEGCKAIIEMIKNKFPKVTEINASAFVENEASQKVLEKSGFIKTGEVKEKISARDGVKRVGVLFKLKIK